MGRRRVSLRQAVRIAAIIVMFGAVGVAVLYVVLERQATVIQRSTRNSDAIRVNCLLLANAIRQSPNGPVARASARSELTALYQRAARRNFTPQERVLEHVLLLRVKAEGAPLTVPDCEMVAKHPESVHAIDLKPKTG